MDNTPKHTVTELHLKNEARHAYGGPLVVSSLALILFGINISQFIHYLSIFWRRDKLLTMIWVLVVMGFNTAAVAYGGIYADWILSIDSWAPSLSGREQALQNGNSDALYSVVMTLVQYFWLASIYRMMASKPKLRWAIIAPVGLLSTTAFALGVALAAIIDGSPEDDGLVTNTQAILQKTCYSCYLAADVIVLVTVLANLLTMRRHAIHLKKSISKLSWTFLIVSAVSTAILIVEIILTFPDYDETSIIYNYIIDVTFLFTPVYTFSMLAILNARHEFFTRRMPENPTALEGEPQMNFTVPSDTADYSYNTNSRNQFTNKDNSESGFDQSPVEKFHRHTVHHGVSRDDESREDFHNGVLSEP